MVETWMPLWVKALTVPPSTWRLSDQPCAPSGFSLLAVVRVRLTSTVLVSPGVPKTLLGQPSNPNEKVCARTAPAARSIPAVASMKVERFIVFSLRLRLKESSLSKKTTGSVAPAGEEFPPRTGSRFLHVWTLFHDA